MLKESFPIVELYLQGDRGRFSVSWSYICKETGDREAFLVLGKTGFAEQFS